MVSKVLCGSLAVSMFVAMAVLKTEVKSKEVTRFEDEEEVVPVVGVFTNVAIWTCRLYGRCTKVPDRPLSIRVIGLDIRFSNELGISICIGSSCKV